MNISMTTARWRMCFLVLAMAITPFGLAHACGSNEAGQDASPNGSEQGGSAGSEGGNGGGGGAGGGTG